MSPLRDLYFLKNYLLISFLHTFMFLASYVRQGTYVAPGQVNGAPNETQTHLFLLTSWKHTK